MAINVFVSGVSSEFRDARTSINAAIGRLRNLSVAPIVQENLSESAAADASLVRKLIDNVEMCELAICLVGKAPGYPEAEQDRRNIMAMAETWLARNGYALGELWEDWKDKNASVGMTYTQLEFFLASSVFQLSKNGVPGPRKRVRVIRHDWSQMTADEKDSIQQHFRTYLEFLHKRQHELDWGCDFNNVTTDVICLVAEFATLNRDLLQKIPEDVPVNSAMERWLSILNNQLQRRALSKELYGRFYGELVRPRRNQKMIVLHQTSRFIQLVGDLQAAYRCEMTNSFVVLLRLTATVECWYFSKQDLSLEKERTFAIEEDEIVFGFEPTSELLLTFSNQRGYQLRQGRDEQVQKIDPGDKAPDPFTSEYAVVSCENDLPKFFVCHNTSWYEFAKEADGKWNLPEASQNAKGARLEPVVIHSSPFQMNESGGANKVEGELVIIQSWGLLSADVIFVLCKQGDDCNGFRLQRYKLQPLGSLFEALQTDWMDAVLYDEVRIVKHDNKTTIQMTDDKHQLLTFGTSANSEACQFNLSLEARTPLPSGKSGSSIDGAWFIETYEEMVQRGKQRSRIQGYYFPMPLYPPDAMSFFDRLQRICRGEVPQPLLESSGTLEP